MKKLILTVSILFGLLLLFGAAWEARRFGNEKQWPTVDAEILESKLFEAEHSSWIEFKYRFEVDGTTYDDDGTLDVQGIVRIPDQYREGKTITVYYDPTDPQRTYLEFAGFASPVGLMIMGLVVLGICVPFAFGWIRIER